ncbi:MAG: hypothetical protein ABSD88_16010 [Candidatus Korobacteraceae bacterium]|jgi:hypothetical protein
MGFRVERSEFDIEHGFLYYLCFKPNLALGQETISARITIQAVIWLSETSDLAELTFEIPKQCRNADALRFIRRETETKYVEPRVFITWPAMSGDAVVDLPAKLDLDFAGRIVGMTIQWVPDCPDLFSPRAFLQQKQIM